MLQAVLQLPAIDNKNNNSRSSGRSRVRAHWHARRSARA